MSGAATPTYDGKSNLVQDRYLVSMEANENLTTLGQAVYVDPAWSVNETNGSTDILFGITLTKANSGNKVTVITRGIVYGTANGAISAGKLLYADASGRVAQATVANLYSAGVPARALSLSATSGAGSGVYFALF